MRAEAFPEEEPRAEVALRPEFLRRIAHELRSPISLVAHVLESVYDELGPQLSDDLRKTTVLADGAVRRCERLAARLDLVADLESGAPHPDLQRTDFVALVERGVEVAQSLERRREVVLTCDLVKGPLMVRANPERFACVVTELVVNAIRHARRRVLVRVELSGADVSFTVEDDGKGVAKDVLDVIFSRCSPPRGKSGLGLGLSIASEVVRAHGGTISTDQSTFPGFDPGSVGARFTVSLKAAET